MLYDTRRFEVTITDCNGETVWFQSYDEYSDAYHIFALLEDGTTQKGNVIELVQYNYANGKYINCEVTDKVGCSL